jgi:hypothetical protein
MNQLLVLLKGSIEDFFVRIENTHRIDVRDDWKQFKEPVHEVCYCVYEYTRNPRKGEVCGLKIKEGEYCSKHRKTKVKMDDTKEAIKDQTEPSKKTSTKPIQVDKQMIVRLYPKIGKFIHQQTKLAFFSSEHKVVYGKLSLDDKIIPLSDKDIETCKKYMFRYDTDLYEKSDVKQVL